MICKEILERIVAGSMFVTISTLFFDLAPGRRYQQTLIDLYAMVSMASGEGNQWTFVEVDVALFEAQHFGHEVDELFIRLASNGRRCDLYANAIIVDA